MSGTGKVYISGQWREIASEFPSVSPEDGELLGYVVHSDAQTVDAAVASAHEALPAWRALGVSGRCALLGKLADALVGEYGEEMHETPLKTLIRREMGKRFPECDIEVIETSDMVRYFADNAPQLLADRPVDITSELWASKRSRVRFEPHGVVAVIKAWNYPLEIPFWSLAPALAAGNTVVFKPSELSSFVGLEIARLCDEAGLPAGVVNVITGTGATGELLARDPRVNMISFTGSNRTGLTISKFAAERLIPVSLELSGNDAAVVLDDANIELATNGVLWGGICNSGQVCVGVKRVFVSQHVYSRFTEMLTQKMAELAPGVDYGPIVSRGQFDRVHSQVQAAVSQGAEILAGGTALSQGDLYYAPTILGNVTMDMDIMKEECFGPVIPIVSYEGDDGEAAILANDSTYGLGCSIWSSNIGRANRLAEAIDVGTVWINDVNVALAEAPWPARKSSGSGVDLSPWGLFEYVSLKHINEETDLAAVRRSWWYPYGPTGK